MLYFNQSIYIHSHVETPTGDYYGEDRKGNNLFAESLVAVDLRTGLGAQV